MQAFEDLKLDHLVGRPDNDVARCNLDSGIANLEPLTAASRELDADIEFIIVAYLSARAPSHAGVTDRLDNPGPGEIVLFDVSIERGWKAMRDLPFPIACTEHRLPDVGAVPQGNIAR
jgi:sirohydrochlorin ferrochelatase